jgi:4-amino-4-deoxy-L-arabinose transferase-like glycosyltransferase
MKKIIVLLILVLAFFLRFWHLGSYPALNADEAAIGYNAYSLIKTGLDEHGNSWPIHFQSFNDYKPGLYFYIVLPFVKFLGLNIWSVRVPSALFGVASVYLLYVLLKELFFNQSVEKIGRLDFNFQTLPLVASFMLAISPWHIHFSRGGWEVNVATFFMLLGSYLFLKALRRPSIFTFSFSLFPFVLSLYTYHAARVVVPLLLLGASVIYIKTLRQNVKTFAVSAFIAFLFLLPLGIDLSKGAVLSRAAGVGLFADPGPLARINEQRGEHTDYTSLSAKLLHNKVVNYTLAFLENWTAHYHGEFLFLSGDIIERNRVPEMGQMYMIDFLFVVAGFFVLANYWSRFNSRQKRGALFILLWLIVAPTAAALTFQSPHALRAQNMVMPLVIISAIGLTGIIGFLKNNIVKRRILAASYLLLVALIAWGFSRYQHEYWVHMAKQFPFSSQYGMKDLVAYINENQDKYENVVITDRYDQPYILFLFYLKYPPSLFQKNHGLSQRDAYGFSTVRKFDKYRFEWIDWDEDKLRYPDSLIVGTDEEIPDEANVVKDIYGINGYKYFQVVAN